MVIDVADGDISMYTTRRRTGRARHVTVAREGRHGYAGGLALGSTTGAADAGAGAGPGLGALGRLDGPLGRLDGAVADVVATDVDALGDEDVRTVMARTQGAIDRLLGMRSKLAGTLESRALRAAGPGRERQALRVVRDRTADELRLTPSEVKRSGETGRRLAEVPAAQRAMTDGDLPPDHARVLADTLQHLAGADRERAERELLPRARHEDATTFGRSCLRLLAEFDAEAAQAAQDRRNARRHLRVTQTPDGMLAVHGQGSGWDAEVVATALHAFARPGPADARSAEQRNWDALVAACRTALDAGEAAENRGARPHALVLVPLPPVGSDAAPPPVEAAWTGPLPWTEVRRHLADAVVSRVLIDAESLPLEASVAVRTVPAGLWKFLLVRDRVCIAEGCTVPAAWCAVMHLDEAFALGGKLSPDNSGLGCSRHHLAYYRCGWVVTWVAGRPVLHHPDRPPAHRSGASARAGPAPPGG
jgi:hypothetical protein